VVKTQKKGNSWNLKTNHANARQQQAMQAVCCWCMIHLHSASKQICVFKTCVIFFCPYLDHKCHEKKEKKKKFHSQKIRNEMNHLSLSLQLQERMAWLKNPPSQSYVSLIHWLIPSRRDSYQHTNKHYQSLSLLSLSLSSFFVFSLFSILCFSLPTIPPFSPLSFHLYSWNSHIRNKQCTIFIKIISIFRIRRNDWSNGKFS